MEGEKISENYFCNECGEPTEPNERYCINCGANLNDKKSNSTLNNERMIRLENPNARIIAKNVEEQKAEQTQQPKSILYIPPKEKKTDTNTDAIISIILALSPLLFLVFFWAGRIIFMILFVAGPVLMGGAIYFGSKGYKKERLRILAMIGILIGLAGFGFVIYFFVSFMSGMG